MKKGHGSILIVEDNPAEQLLIKEAFEQIGVQDPIYTVNDGSEAIAFVKGQGQYADRKKFRYPTFLLTDLKMPKVNGFELLLYLKRSRLIVIPTIVFTMSDDKDDIKKAFMLGANAFHTKTHRMEGLIEQLTLIHKYWTSVQLPDVDEHGHVLPTHSHGKLGEKLPVHLHDHIRHED